MKPAYSGFVLPLVIGLVLALTVLGTAFYLQLKPKPQTPNSKSQTQNRPATQSATSDPTANWKTYTSEKYKYSFKYPSSWEVKIREEAEYESVGTYQFYFYVSKSNPNDCRGDCPASIYWSDEKIGDYSVKKSVGLIGGVGGATPQYYHDVIFSRGGHYYIFTLYELDEESDSGDMNREALAFKAEDLKTFNQILSTFKFVE